METSLSIEKYHELSIIANPNAPESTTPASFNILSLLGVSLTDSIDVSAIIFSNSEKLSTFSFFSFITLPISS